MTIIAGKQHVLAAVVAIFLPGIAVAQSTATYFDPPVYTPNLFVNHFYGSASGDLNGDGRDDLVLAVANSIAAFVTTPQGTIGPATITQFPATYAASTHPQLHDFDQDGILDAIVFDAGAGHRVFRGDGIGGFTQLALLPYLTPSGGPVNMIDLDRDGAVEVVLNGYVAQAHTWTLTHLHVVRVRGGTFSHVATIPTGYNLFAPRFADINGDGNPDILGIVRGGGGFVGIYTALGTGSLTSFGPPTILPFPFTSGSNIGVWLTAADTDSNGRDDLILSSWDDPSPWSPAPAITRIHVCLDPLGTAGWNLMAAPGFLPHMSAPISARDINGDGILDLIGLQSCSPYNFVPTVPCSMIGMAMGDGTGYFLAPQVLTIPGSFTFPNFGIADFDGDGDQDVYMVQWLTSAIALCRNQARFGIGCAGSGAMVPQISTGIPQPGNSAFTLNLDQAPANSPALFGLSLGALPSPGACSVVVDLTPPNLILPFPLALVNTNVMGQATMAFPLPNDPQLTGATAYAQWGIADSSAPFGVALSRGAKIILW